MGVMPIPKLLLTMAISLMLSLLVQSLYNIVDSIYVSHISEKALTATSLAYPVQILMIALGVGTAVVFFGAYFRLQSFLFMPMNGWARRVCPSSGTITGRKIRIASGKW